MLEINKLGSFTSEHCEEKSVSAGAINAGSIADKLGVRGSSTRSRRDNGST